MALVSAVSVPVTMQSCAASQLFHWPFPLRRINRRNGVRLRPAYRGDWCRAGRPGSRSTKLSSCRCAHGRPSHCGRTSRMPLRPSGRPTTTTCRSGQATAPTRAGSRRSGETSPRTHGRSQGQDTTALTSSFLFGSQDTGRRRGGHPFAARPGPLRQRALARTEPHPQRVANVEWGGGTPTHTHGVGPPSWWTGGAGGIGPLCERAGVAHGRGLLQPPLPPPSRLLSDRG